MSAVERARSLIGCTYRSFGRDPSHGLDCLGLILCSFELERTITGSRDGRNVPSESLVRELERSFRQIQRREDGDLIIMRRGKRWHFAIGDGDAFIHADARLRRVVRRRGALPWPQHSLWRLKMGNDDGDAHPTIRR